jgi:uncharacterized membrane protein
MNVLYVIGGIIASLFGIYTTITEIKIIRKGEKDIFANDSKLLLTGVFLMIFGILIVIRYFPVN